MNRLHFKIENKGSDPALDVEVLVQDADLTIGLWNLQDVGVIQVGTVDPLTTVDVSIDWKPRFDISSLSTVPDDDFIYVAGCVVGWVSSSNDADPTNNWAQENVHSLFFDVDSSGVPNPGIILSQDPWTKVVFKVQNPFSENIKVYLTATSPNNAWEIEYSDSFFPDYVVVNATSEMECYLWVRTKSNLDIGSVAELNIVGSYVSTTHLEFPTLYLVGNTSLLNVNSIIGDLHVNANGSPKELGYIAFGAISVAGHIVKRTQIDLDTSDFYSLGKIKGTIKSLDTSDITGLFPTNAGHRVIMLNITDSMGQYHTEFLNYDTNGYIEYIFTNLDIYEDYSIKLMFAGTEKLGWSNVLSNEVSTTSTDEESPIYYISGILALVSVIILRKTRRRKTY